MPVERRLVKLKHRYDDTSRMTRWRFTKEPDFPTPIVIRGRPYYYDDELTAWEERRRRRRAKAPSSDTAISTNLNDERRPR
jgi:hypothetical protein